MMKLRIKECSIFSTLCDENITIKSIEIIRAIGDYMIKKGRGQVCTASILGGVKGVKKGKKSDARSECTYRAKSVIKFD